MSKEREEYIGKEICQECGLPIPACNKIVALSNAVENLLRGSPHAAEHGLQTLEHYGRPTPGILALLKMKTTPPDLGEVKD